MKIRNLKHGDIKEIIALAKSTEHFAISEDYGFWGPDQLHAWVNNLTDIFLVTENNNEIVGFVLTLSHSPTRKCIIENIFVRDDYRGKKIGESLLQESLRQLKSRGIQYIVGEIHKDNMLSERFFKKNGFTKGMDMFWMIKKI